MYVLRLKLIVEADNISAAISVSDVIDSKQTKVMLRLLR